MNLKELLRTAYRGLISNKMRSALTVLGIIIGVTSVITLTSIGNGSQAAITSNIESLGTNLVFVTPGATTQSGGVRSAAGSASTLTLEDADALTAAPTVQAVAPQVESMSQVIAGKENIRTTIYGVTPDYESVRNSPVAEGTFITTEQVNSRALVAVLGSSAATTLFGTNDPVGQTVKIGGNPYKVIGVLKSQGGTGFGSADDSIMAPITTVQYRLSSQRSASGAQSVQSINVQVDNAKDINTAITQITAILAQRHNITNGQNDFTITSQQATVAALSSSEQIWVIFLGAIAGISLLVGGIGIMNIMLVSVTERTREIGIRKAVGAKRRDILLQFLFEATLLSLIGGAIGVGIGYGVSHFISGISIGGQIINTSISAGITILAVTVSAAIGIIFGLYPAYRAARLKPIEALHYE